MNIRPMLIYSFVVVGLMLALSAWAWTQLPADASIPIHWGVDGQPNGFAPKPIGLFLLPGITALITALFAVIPRIEPRRANLERSGTAYRATLGRGRDAHGRDPRRGDRRRARRGVRHQPASCSSGSGRSSS